MFIFYLADLLFYLSICGFFLNYHYYLKSLMMIEFIMISIMIIMLVGIFGFSQYFIYVLILSVCEGVIGLLMVVLMCRFWGVDSYALVDFLI